MAQAQLHLDELETALPQFGLEHDAEWLGTVVGIRRLSDLEYVTEKLLQELEGTPVAKSKLESMAAAYLAQKSARAGDADKREARHVPADDLGEQRASRGAEDKRGAGGGAPTGGQCMAESETAGGRVDGKKPQQVDQPCLRAHDAGSMPPRLRVKLDTGPQKVWISISASCSVAQACTEAKRLVPGLGSISTLAIQDGAQRLHLIGGDKIAKVVRDLHDRQLDDMLFAVFEAGSDDAPQALGTGESNDSDKDCVRRKRLADGSGSQGSWSAPSEAARKRSKPDWYRPPEDNAERPCDHVQAQAASLGDSEDGSRGRMSAGPGAPAESDAVKAYITQFVARRLQPCADKLPFQKRIPKDNVLEALKHSAPDGLLDGLSDHAAKRRVFLALQADERWEKMDVQPTSVRGSLGYANTWQHVQWKSVALSQSENTSNFRRRACRTCKLQGRKLNYCSAKGHLLRVDPPGSMKRGGSGVASAARPAHIKASQRQAKRMQKIRVKNFSRMPQPVDQVCLRFVCIMYHKYIVRFVCIMTKNISLYM